MSVLTGPEIRRLAEGGVGPNGERIIITPFDPARCQPASYDLTMGKTVRVYDTRGYVHHGRWVSQEPLDLEQDQPLIDYQTETCGRWLFWPGRVYLGTFSESTETHRLSADVKGRSSVGRKGLFIHATAGWVDPGYIGDETTLEFIATEPVFVRPGCKIGQLVYHTLTGEYQEYRGRYQRQPAEPVASRFHLPDPKE